MAAAADRPASLPASPVKAPPEPATPEQLARSAARLDAILAVMVVLFAFVLACFPAYNSDILQQLAVGRLVASGSYPFGSDPFSYAADGYVVNHSWLFGLGSYLIYKIPNVGGEVLTVLKAGLIAMLAVLLLRLASRKGQSRWIPVGCVALSVLVMSARFFLQSGCISIVLLGLTLYLLRLPRLAREGRDGLSSPPTYRAFYFLPLLCALWVNVDAWFLLGPITIALYWLGDVVTDRLGKSKDGPDRLLPGESKHLAIALVASVAACLLNPHHVYAFQLPVQLGLSPVAQLAQQEPLFHNLFLSPFDMNEYMKPANGYNVAGMAYFVLLVLGVVSFILAGLASLDSGKALAGWRVTLWLFFGALSGWHSRAIPFFAVVMGPIMALNFADYVARLRAMDYSRDSIAGRWLSVIVGALLVVLAIPGWLQADPQRLRHFGWGVVPDPSLERLTVEINKLLQEGKLPADIHWFNTTPEGLYHLVWFCPGQKGYLDQRLTPSAEDAAAYFKARLALNGGDKESEAAPSWRALFRSKKIDYIIHTELNPFNPSVMLLRFLRFPDEWVQLGSLFAQGRASVVGWQDPRSDLVWPQRLFNESFRELRQNLFVQAFGPDCVPAPRTRPIRKPNKMEWYEAIWQTEPASPIEASESALYFTEFRERSLIQRDQLGKEWQKIGNQAFLSCMVIGSLGGPLTSMTLVPSFSNFQLLFDDGPPPALYLAVRAARRGLARNPDDARSYLALGQAYFSLLRFTRERWMLQNTQREPAISLRYGNLEWLLIRQTQALAALNQAVELNPDLIEAHDMLTELYSRLIVMDQPPGIPAARGQRRWRPAQFLDLYVKHLKEVVRLAKMRGILPGENPQQMNDRFNGMDKRLEQAERALNKQEQEYVIKEQRNSVIDKALQARALGLANQAKLVLLDEKNKPEDREGGYGIFVTIDHLLDMGDLDAARELFSLSSAEALGRLPEQQIPSYEWVRLRLAAASGDYDEADSALAESLKVQRGQGRQFLANQEVSALFHIFVPALVPTAPQVSGLGVMSFLPILKDWPSLRNVSRQGRVAIARREAELLLLRGLLALEAGAIKDSRKYLSESLALRQPGERVLPSLLLTLGPAALYVSDATGLLSEGMDFNGSSLGEIGLSWIQSVAR